MTSTRSISSHSRTVALAIVGVAAALSLAGCGGTSTTPVADDVPTTPPTTTPAPVVSSSASTDNGADVPVYFVGQTPQGLRLFPETRQVQGTDPAAQAVALMASGTAIDPDYRSLFPSGGDAPVSVSVDAKAITMTLPSATTWATRGDLTPAEADLAVQQLVWTLQGATGTKLPVLVKGSSGATSPLLGVATTKGLTAAAPLTVEGLVQVAAPAQGATVSGTLHASGMASSYEGTILWSLHRGGASGPSVKDGYATAKGYLDHLYPWKAAISLAGLKPGAYTFVASTSSEGEGAGATVDTKSITVS